MNVIESEKPVSNKNYPNTTVITTHMVDDIWDCLQVYRTGDSFTDDGYMFFQLECAGRRDKTKILKRAAKYFGCKVKNEEICCEHKDHDEGLARILQACTAVAVIIMESRFKGART